jgi:hypothetical protein
MADVRGIWIEDEEQARAIIRTQSGNGEMQLLVIRAYRYLAMRARARSPEGRAEIERNHAFITHPDRARERAQLVPTRRGYGVTIPDNGKASYVPSLPCRDTGISGTRDDAIAGEAPCSKSRTRRGRTL